MKKNLLLIIMIFGGLMTINAQMNDYLISFEADTDTAGWVVFANGAMPADDDVTVVENPDTTGINPTEMALRFVVNDDADPWVGMVNNVAFTGDSALAITEENHIFTMMVYKTVVSNVGLKLEQETGGGGVFELLVPNTLVNEWELLTFDFSEVIGNTYEALVIFPDFPEMRTAGTVVYIDNITFGEGPPATSVNQLERMSLKVYPNPAESHLYIQHPGMTSYSISNSLGQMVETKAFSITDIKMIELDRLKSGIHFITVQSDKGTQTTRFIKK
jgi:hypothetical protein